MRVHNPDIAMLSATRARPAAGGVAKAGIPASGSLTERHVAAFSVLGVENVVLARSGAAIQPASGTDGGKSLDGLAADYARTVADTKDAQPGISDANARHIARYKTIMANRASFPPGKFSLHAELANGQSISAHVPARGGAMEASKVAVPAAVTGALVNGVAGAQPSVTTGQMEAAYGEWL